MMTGGMLSQGPAEFGEHYKRKWLVADYEARDAVFHNAYSVSDYILTTNPRAQRTETKADTCLDDQP
jgi:phytanoyl-CoA hydroxylase